MRKEPRTYDGKDLDQAISFAFALGMIAGLMLAAIAGWI